MPFFARVFGAAVGVRKVRVAAVDDDVALLEMRQQLLDHLIDRVAGLHHQHDAPRPLQHFREFFDGMRADYLRALGFVVDELVDFGNGSIEDRHFVSVVVHVQDQVLAHDGKADQSDVTEFILHVRDLPFVEASRALFTVSPQIDDDQNDWSFFILSLVLRTWTLQAVARAVCKHTDPGQPHPAASRQFVRGTSTENSRRTIDRIYVCETILSRPCNLVVR